jgi:hypothetical protein
MIKKVVPQMGDGIKKTEVNEQLRFSFRYFTHDEELSPQVFAEAYLPKLLERLKGLSSWTLKQFTGTTVKAAETTPSRGQRHRVQMASCIYRSKYEKGVRGNSASRRMSTVASTAC